MNTINVPTSPTPGGAAPPRKKILVVDDDKALCDLCSKALSVEGYQVWSAYNGEDALKIYKAEQPDLLVLDVAMPGISGFDVAREVRKMDSPSKHTLILLVTAYARSFFVSNEFQAGIDSFFTKPIMPEDLVTQVSVLMS